MDQSRRLEMLVKAADSGSFAAAAKLMDLTPSAVSRGIGELERSLKVSLFNRTTRQLRLTEDGAQIYARATDILARMAELEASTVNRHSRVSGTVRVGVLAPLSRYVLMPHLPTLQSRHPDLRVETRLTQDPNDMQAENLDVLLHVGEPPSSRLIAQRLGQGRPAAYASPDYLRRCGEPAEPDDLSRHRCLVFRRPWSTQHHDQWNFEREGVRKTVAVAPILITPDREGLIVAAMAGAGVMYMACFDPAFLAAGRLVRLLPDWSCPASFNIYALYRRNKIPAPRVSAFIQFVREAFAAFDPQEQTVLHTSLTAERSAVPGATGSLPGAP
nr:LysR family transcriptional regulator [uncultured Roseateles sp.]